MNVIEVALAVEDVVAEALVSAVISQAQLPIAIGSVLQKRGVTYLRSRADSLNASANGGVKIILLADADCPTCPVRLAQEWFPGGRHSNLAFRFSVHAAEAWVLADPAGLSNFAGINARSIPVDPDLIADPKRALVTLARRARREFREMVVPSEGVNVPVGVGYNAAVTHFIRQEWSLSRASAISSSLRSFQRRLERLSTSG